MIDIAKLSKEDVGKWVIYTPSRGATEKGRIKSWNDTYVFVVYNCNDEWYRFEDFTSHAASPANLRILGEREEEGK